MNSILETEIDEVQAWSQTGDVDLADSFARLVMHAPIYANNSYAFNLVAIFQISNLNAVICGIWVQVDTGFHRRWICSSFLALFIV